MKLLQSESVVTLFEKIARVGATIAWITIALVTFVDVIGREIFDAPIPGGYEIIQVLMTIGIFFSLPIVALKKGHVSVDLFFERFSKRYQRLISFIARLAAIGFFSLLAWAMGLIAWHTLGTHEHTVYLGIPYWLVALLMALFLIMTTLCTLIAHDKKDKG